METCSCSLSSRYDRKACANSLLCNPFSVVMTHQASQQAVPHAGSCCIRFFGRGQTNQKPGRQGLDQAQLQLLQHTVLHACSSGAGAMYFTVPIIVICSD
ncbi:hypothetical protein EON64_18510 [archaeon]|nr:MAG: hypothetical protein EON64_18510 [archaeon]